MATATGGHCTEYGIPTRVINTPSESRQQISDLARSRPDVVKIVYDHETGRLPSIDRATLEAAVTAARDHGLKTVVHVGTWQDVRDAAEAGASAVTHVPWGKMPEEIPSLLLASNTAVIPTLVVQTDFLNLTRDSTLLEAALLSKVAGQATIDSYRDIAGINPRLRSWLDRGALSFTDRGHYEHSRARGSLLSWAVAEVGEESFKNS